jgi:hypothetical protein
MEATGRPQARIPEPEERGRRYPVVLEGRRASPPEDVGGPHGYQDLLEVLQDPEHEEHVRYRIWVRPRFDPEHFDLTAVNRRLARLPRTNRTALRIVTERHRG